MQNIIEDVHESIRQPILWDMEIAEDDLRYSSWFSGLSSAGIALVLLNYTEIVNLSVISDFYTDMVLSLCMLGFFIALLFGGLVKRHVSAYLETSRMILTCLVGQKMMLSYDEDIVERISSEDPLEITSNFNDGEYVPDHIKETWCKLNNRNREFSTRYNKEYRIQEGIVILGYFSIVCLGAPILKHFI